MSLDPRRREADNDRGGGGDDDDDDDDNRNDNDDNDDYDDNHNPAAETLPLRTPTKPTHPMPPPTLPASPALVSRASRSRLGRRTHQLPRLRRGPPGCQARLPTPEAAAKMAAAAKATVDTPALFRPRSAARRFTSTPTAHRRFLKTRSTIAAVPRRPRKTARLHHPAVCQQRQRPPRAMRVCRA